MIADKTAVRSMKPISGAGKLLHFTIGLAIAWTLVLAFSTLWNTLQRKKITRALANKEARAHFNKDQAFRYWATLHGGVYVSANDRTPPNPDLQHIKERDITTTSGKQLTLMNPAYMLRQMMEEYSSLYGVKGRITSLKPLNVNNTPDDWERSALMAFAKGKKEMSAYVDIDNIPHLRLIQPMITKPGCLKCHAHQGYELDDVRGAVGVSVPMEPYLKLEYSEIKQLAISHLLIWLLGLMGIYLGFLRLNYYFNERIRIKKALQSSEEQFRALVEQAGDAIFMIDPDGRILNVNQESCESLGFTREELLSFSIQDIDTHLPDREDIRQIWEMLSSKPILTLEGHHKRKDGTIFPVEMRTSLLHLTGYTCVLALVRDTTLRKAAEVVLRQSREDLEKMVDKRTKQLSDANKELDAFAYSVSHDLRAPLRRIDGFSLALMEDFKEALDDTAKDYLNRIRGGCRRMGMLIDDMLKLSRLSRGRIQKKDLDLSRMAREISEDFMRTEPEREVTINISEGIRAQGDSVLVRAVLENLLGNAWKFTSKTRDAKISFGTVERNGDTKIFIQDNGIGFDMAYADKLFNAFQRLHSGREFEGTGIGLATVQRILHRHGGTIFAESEVGNGAVFFFSL